MKDYFSGHSKIYAAFRPTYPDELFEFVLANTSERNTAWDCATGNGQVAKELSRYFRNVFATDISARQLNEAHQEKNIHYSVSPAEKTSFNDHQFDLITVGQALHWFDRDAFYREAKRVGKPGSTIAVWGYATLSINTTLDPILLNFYNNTVGPYWDNARRLVEDEYRSIEFPFNNVQRKQFSIVVKWTLDELSGYLESWSATQKYIKTNNSNPVNNLRKELEIYWTNDETKTVSFPVFVLLGTM